nr:type III-A CRISPR-associated RAMP protein Csm4 [Methanobrevibacter ruminantium]
MKIVYLKPKSTFPFLSSDSIFGALTYGMAELFPEKLDSFIESFKNKNDIPFLISSAFPFIKNENNYFRFYPKPITKFQSKDMKLSKKFKKIKFIEEDIFLELVSGNISNDGIFDNFKDDLFLVNEFNESFLVKKENSEIIDGSLFSKEISPHNVIDRVKNNSINIFYSEDYRFRENKGLFFLVDFKDSSFEEIFISLLRFLRDKGFGHDISSGKGQFDFEIDDFDKFDNLNKSQYFLSLSRFIPDEKDISFIEELSDDDALYEIGDKRSRDSFGLRKKTRFFKEGSVFPDYTVKYDVNCGCLVETSDRSIEYGYSFNIPYNVEEL